MFTKKKFLIGLGVFIFLNIYYYAFLFLHHNLINFNKRNYIESSHHYLADERANKQFNLIRTLGNWDGQWYLRIADSGYPSKQELLQNNDRRHLGGLTWAFLPVYPITIWLVNLFIHNVEISAFVLQNILLLANFFSLYYLISKLYSPKVAMKTNFLLFFFPLSLFYRSYYVEGLFLLLLIWYTYFLIKKKWWYATLLLTTLCLVKANGFFLLLPLLTVLFTQVKEKKLSIEKASVLFLFPLLSFLGWLKFNQFKLNDPYFWIKAHHVWYNSPSLITTIKQNIFVIVNFLNLPIHSFHASAMEVGTFFIVLFILYKSRKTMSRELWLTALALSLLPLLIKDFTSYTRYQIVSFPLFIYLATKLKGVWFWSTLIVFFMTLLFASVHFINWSWVD
jgi:hypothetical protein